MPMAARPVRTGRAVVVSALALLLLGGAPVSQRRGQAPATDTAPASPAPATATATRADDAVPLVAPRVVARFPHDRSAFTEGLLWHRGALYESVGLEGQSEVRRVALDSGRILARAAIPAAQFGEGLAEWHGALVSLTWHDGIARRWSIPALHPLGTLRYAGEGWGLTSDGAALIRSDGSATLTFHDPVTMKVRRTLAVTIRGRSLTMLNELEWIDGRIYANVWHTPYIVRIDPHSGRVDRVLDLSALAAEIGATDPEAVANGIAWDAAQRRLFVTGKRWPTVFEIAVP